jgi:asparagine synthase (glutamine-hydrolysing)
MNQYISAVVDLTDPHANCLYSLTLDKARECILRDPATVRNFEGSFAIVARDGRTVRLARSLDRPLRYFLAKRHEGPALIVADRIDAIRDWLTSNGFATQFHPSYTRMVPAHYVVEIQLVGCPDPDPTYTRFFTPERNTLPLDLNEIGHRYVGALANETAKWLRHIPDREPIGICFSGGIDSGSVFVVTLHVMQRLGMNPARLKAFILDCGEGQDLRQSREFLERLGHGLYLEPIEANLDLIDVAETIAVIEDYKPLDVQCASMAMLLCRGIRQRYPDWRLLIDGDGGDENLKDYPIEENPELTIRSVVSNLMLYQEGWGVGRIKHSLTYSGGLSRSYTRTYAPARHFGFEGFSPFTRPDVISVAEAIPFDELTESSVDRLYALKGDIVSRGVKAITGIDMPIFPKRRFQHGAVPKDRLHSRLPNEELVYRRQFLSQYA